MFLGDYTLFTPFTPFDLGKPNMSSADPVHGTWRGQLQALYQLSNSSGTYFLLQLTMPLNTSLLYGAPTTVWVQVAVLAGQRNIQFTLLLLQKTPTRLTEAHWFSFNPVLASAQAAWRMDKLGEWVDPMAVINQGAMHMHALGEGGMTYGDVSTSTQPLLSVLSPDAPLVSVSGFNPFPTPFGTPNITSTGIALCLFNNVWGTNYPMWYPFVAGDENIRYRFSVNFM